MKKYDLGMCELVNLSKDKHYLGLLSDKHNNTSFVLLWV